MKLKPYPEYRDSGVDWLGKIPKHWESLRSKYLLREIDERTETGTEELFSVSQYTGVLPRKSKITDESMNLPRAASLVGYKKANKNDLIINIMLAWNGSLGIAPSSGIVSPAYCVYRFQKRYIPKYFHYLLRTPLYKSKFLIESTGVIKSRLRLYTDHLYRIEFLIPPKEEQKQIVAFLDTKTEEISRFIANKRRLIELLKEQKQANINKAVTQGITPNVRLKPSGVEWLGDVPEHWEVRRLKTIAQIMLSSVDKHTIEDEFPVKLCNYVDVYKNDFITNQITFMKATATHEEIDSFELKSGDVIITKDSESWDDIAVPAYVSQRLENVICAYHLALIKPYTEIMNGEYLFRAFSADSIADQFRVSANGITRYGLSQIDIKSSFFPLPPKQEQIKIVQYIRKKCSDIDAAITRAEQEIGLMEEYRVRLISDAVTGAVDVR